MEHSRGPRILQRAFCRWSGPMRVLHSVSEPVGVDQDDCFAEPEIFRSSHLILERKKALTAINVIPLSISQNLKLFYIFTENLLVRNIFRIKTQKYFAFETKKYFRFPGRSCCLRCRLCWSRLLRVSGPSRCQLPRRYLPPLNIFMFLKYFHVSEIFSCFWNMQVFASLSPYQTSWPYSTCMLSTIENWGQNIFTENIWEIKAKIFRMAAQY